MTRVTVVRHVKDVPYYCGISGKRNPNSGENLHAILETLASKARYRVLSLQVWERNRSDLYRQYFLELYYVDNELPKNYVRVLYQLLLGHGIRISTRLWSSPEKGQFIFGLKTYVPISS